MLLIDTIPTIVAVMNPIISSNMLNDKDILVLDISIISSIVEAIIMGIESKKLYSVVSFLSHWSNSPVAIVEPLRLIPGKQARPWVMPIIMLLGYEILRFVILYSECLFLEENI